MTDIACQAAITALLFAYCAWAYHEISTRLAQVNLRMANIEKEILAAKKEATRSRTAAATIKNKRGLK